MDINLNKMTNAEKLELISKIWDSISVKDDHVKVLQEREQNDEVKISRDVAKEQIRKVRNDLNQ